MWIPAGIVYVIAGLCLAAGWLREAERKVLQRESRGPSRGLQAAGMLLLCMMFTTGCQSAETKLASAATGGDPSRGRAAIATYGCSSCHTIPGVRDAIGLVGPNLDRIASRNYIGGVLQNTPDNMIRWLQNPPGVDPMTAMPNVHLSEADARDIAGYLYTLR
jgi:cytochrome c2